MSSAQQINATFRKQIRNRQKQDFFKKIRSQSNLQYHQANQRPVFTNFPLSIDARSSQCLKDLTQSLANNQIRVWNRIFDQSIHIDLMDNLKQGILVQETFELLCAILRQQKIKVASKFVKLQLINELFKYSEYGSPFIIYCINILGNIIYENKDNAEIVLQNGLYKHLFTLIDKLILSNNNCSNEQLELGGKVMWAIVNVFDIEGKMFQQQFFDLLHFCREVWKKDVYHREILELLFYIGFEFRSQTFRQATEILNKFLNQATSETKYLQKLLIVIKIYSPIQINYCQVSSLITLAAPKYVTYGLRILDRIVEICPDSIPRNFQWWQRIYFKSERVQDKEMLVKLMYKTKLKTQWVYQILHEILKNSSGSKTLMKEILICINWLLESSNNETQIRDIKFCLKSSGINQQLHRLQDLKDIGIKAKCESLIMRINFQRFPQQ